MRHKTRRYIFCVCIIIIIFFSVFFLRREGKYTRQQALRVVDRYQSQLESVAKYMISDSPNGRYLNMENSEDNYLNCPFVPQTIKEEMEVYFNQIAPQGDGSIDVLRDDTKWYWHLSEVPKRKNIVSFFLYMGFFADDPETGNKMEEYQMLYYSDMTLGELQALLNSAPIYIYEVFLIKENWFLVTVR